MITCIIPSRLKSSRFFKKPLHKINEKELILHVCDIAKKSKLIDNFFVASEDDEILNLVSKYNFNFIKTHSHLSCTHKVSEVSKKLNCDYVINLQGDEPCIDPKWIDNMIEFSLDNNYDCVQGTYYLTEDDLNDDDCVKCVVNNQNIIFLARNISGINLLGISGVYFYKKQVIDNFMNYDLSLVNYNMGLDTLGFIGKVPVIPYIFPKRTHAVDRLEDIKIVERYLKNEIHY